MRLQYSGTLFIKAVRKISHIKRMKMKMAIVPSQKSIFLIKKSIERKKCLTNKKIRYNPSTSIADSRFPELSGLKIAYRDGHSSLSV